jgi:hypothetical protein
MQDLSISIVLLVGKLHHVDMISKDRVPAFTPMVKYARFPIYNLIVTSVSVLSLCTDGIFTLFPSNIASSSTKEKTLIVRLSKIRQKLSLI